MAKITEISVAQFQFAEGAAPATPASGVVKIYAKTDGKLYSKDDAGTESPLGGSTQTKALSFYIDGTLALETQAMTIIAPCALTVTEIRVAVDTAPTGADLIIDVNKNGTTLYTTQGNRPTIAIDGTSATATDPDVTSIAVGDKISIDIDQIGSTVAGANLAATVICEVA